MDIFKESIRALHPPVPICVPSGTPVRAAIRAMQERKIGCILVTQGEQLAGIFTDRDITRHIAGRTIDLDTVPIDSYMSKNPESLRPHHPIAFAMNRMSLGGYRHVPIVDEHERPVGIISVKDIVNHLVERFPQEIYNLPPEPDVHPSAREGA